MSSRQPLATEIANLHLQSLQLSWDSYPEERATVDDMALGKMEAFLKRVKEGGRFRGEGDWQVVLEKLGYLSRGSPELHQPDGYSDQDIRQCHHFF